MGKEQFSGEAQGGQEIPLTGELQNNTPPIPPGQSSKTDIPAPNSQHETQQISESDQEDDIGGFVFVCPIPSSIRPPRSRSSKRAYKRKDKHGGNDHSPGPNNPSEAKP